MNYLSTSRWHAKNCAETVGYASSQAACSAFFAASFCALTIEKPTTATTASRAISSTITAVRNRLERFTSVASLMPLRVAVVAS